MKNFARLSNPLGFSLPFPLPSLKRQSFFRFPRPSRLAKLSLLTFLAFTALSPTAFSQNNDFVRSDGQIVPLSKEDLRKQIEVTGEIFVTDGTGRLLNQSNESRIWKFGKAGDLDSNWSFESPGHKAVALKHIWTISPEGKILVHLTQYDQFTRGPKPRQITAGKVLREEKIEVKNFEAISWVAHSNDSQRTVLRLTPRLSEKKDLIDMSDLPISLKDAVVYDSKGKVWTSFDELEGKYLGLRTHAGQLGISYVPFKGAKEIGFVSGNEIELSTEDGGKITLKSSVPILASQRPAKIYGFIDLNKKTESLNSLLSSSSSKEKEFLENF